MNNMATNSPQRRKSHVSRSREWIDGIPPRHEGAFARAAKEESQGLVNLVQEGVDVGKSGAEAECAHVWRKGSGTARLEGKGTFRAENGCTTATSARRPTTCNVHAEAPCKKRTRR